jgi:hypothetical protein
MFSRSQSSLRALGLGVTMVAATTAFGQFGSDKPLENPPLGTAYLTANVGSFKILARGATPVTGTLTMTFTGTVLVSGLQQGGRISVTGNVRREYNNEKERKQLYHGSGSITISGKTTAIQWFGRNMSAKFNGFGLIRAYGEFDKNMETGRWWYEGDEARKKYWMANGATPIAVPKEEAVQGPGRRPPTRRSDG